MHKRTFPVHKEIGFVVNSQQRLVADSRNLGTQPKRSTTLSHLTFLFSSILPCRKMTSDPKRVSQCKLLQIILNANKNGQLRMMLEG